MYNLYMHKIFISFHSKDINYKKYMSDSWSDQYFIDGSVETGDIPENMEDQKIREKIRDDYLRDTSVTVVLVGLETKYRKHVDWEIGSSMVDGPINKKSGIVIVKLPNTNNNSSGYNSEMKRELNKIRTTNFVSKTTDYKILHPELPLKLSENVDREDVLIPIINWNDIIANPKLLEEAIDFAYSKRKSNDYFISEFRRKNG